MELTQIFFPAIDHHLLMRRRFVVQLAVVTGDPELLNQSELGQQLRFAENNFGKNLVVEKIQAPGTKPNQVDQKNRERDDREENDRKEPLQNALKHRSTCSPLIPDWSIKTCSRLALSRRNRDLQTRRQSAVATADSSPAADAIDAFHQAPDLGIDLTWKIAAFSMNYFQRYKEFPIELIRCRPDTFVNQIVELIC